jgi:hypothetical protein
MTHWKIAVSDSTTLCGTSSTFRYDGLAATYGREEESTEEGRRGVNSPHAWPISSQFEITSVDFHQTIQSRS